MSTLQDILSDELKTAPNRITVQHVFDEFSGFAEAKKSLAKSKTLGQAKSLLGFYELVKLAIDHYESRGGTPEINRVTLVEEDPDIESQTETITYSLMKREPGAFSQGAPMEGRVKNQRPRYREAGNDPSEPGYRYVVYGYWYDNIVRFTCWARTNKTANKRAEWFEDMMHEYSWWFKAQGVDRVLFYERQPDLTVVIDGNKWYGRPFDYFVRTEKLRVFKEKQLEEIIIKLGIGTSP